ncbi:MAG: histidine ammonia-lyase [Candidatus Marinimicrobia bacterium]|jgi:histidine ammonia-lyase|nr:histidine ammonia-lyase [Candidatus Neomarinimicrobiota bacterium]HJM47442.1 histidine ammonia-lyase [Candidatus Neomarinimicrobiota bacterium]|tara:strand:+ start:4278 stop:5804 length:1527 start_codon:yes stop_codon:yes gene_type:complete
MSGLIITKDNFTFKDFKLSLQKPVHIELPSGAKDSINKSHRNLQSILTSGIPVYGVTTGFGKLSHVKINPSDQRKLQLNLVRSHAAGVGRAVDDGIVRTMMILKILTFVKGYSGVRLSVVKQMINFLNEDIVPVVPEKGSVGASGDLAQLAHMGLALIGEGDVFYKGKRTESKLIMDRLGIAPLELEPKEGISLINGTHYSTALAIAILNISQNLLQCADIIGALSVESSLSSRNVFNPKIHYLKDHPGQRDSAENVWNILSDSNIVSSHKECEKIQDPYSFRCIPHVHGASRDMINNAANCVNNEINSVSDNPLIFSENEIQSSGHFHAEHIAQAMDSVGIALSEIGAISQKRIHYFMKGIENKIPPFLALNPGIESGYMLAQVTAGALASENKTLSHPASVDSTTTSAGQEDFVSMAPWAGQKASMIAENTATILSIELMVSATAAQLFLKDFRPSSVSREIFNEVNTFLKYDTGDRPLDKEIQELKSLIISEKITKTVENIYEMK